MLMGEGKTRAGFHVSFKSNSFCLLCKTYDDLQLPWTELGRVRRTTGIVLCKAPVYIIS